jgi:hypothetical protein
MDRVCDRQVLSLAWQMRGSWSEELAPGLPVLPAAIAEARMRDLSAA